MARKKTLPLIEDFDNIPAEALVPKDEQPYQIPEHWKWVRLGKIARFQGGGTPDKSNPAYWNGDIPWASVKDLTAPSIVSTQDHISEEGLSNSSAELCVPGDLLLATRIDPGRAAIASTAISINQDLKIVRSRLASNTYLRNWFTSIPDWFSQSASGTTVKGVTINKLNAMPLPLPPLEEQQRIVEYIKQTSAKIDDVVQRLEQYLNEAPNRSIKLIQHGVSGELTKSWRQERGCPIDEWESLTLGDAFKWSSGGTPSRKRPEYYKGTIPWIKSGELTDARISDSEEHITEDAVANSSAKLFPPNSVLIAMYGATIGRIGILDRPAATNQAIACAFPSNDTIPEFLALFLRAKKRDFIKLGKGGAQPNISQTVIKAFPFRRPSKEEQELIVETVWNGLAKIEASVELTQRTIDRLTKVREHTILAALSGMLSSRQCGYQHPPLNLLTQNPDTF
ncbi:restriction endonuclease subunit S [Trueperella pyogenes]|uniref:restriction endonuclease subunit S n=1 Tax=Trueperella pyogenes TaxID=1661 RepID=UPI00345D951F